MRLLDWLLRRRADDDLQDEIRAHLSMAAQDRIEDGEDPRAARLASLKEFGNVTLTREATRRSWGGALARLRRRVRPGRALRRASAPPQPGYALVVVAVLALGIGANVAVFALFNGLALKPIPGVEGSARLGVLVGANGGRPHHPALVPRLPRHEREHGRSPARRHVDGALQPRPRHPRRARVRRDGHRQLLPGAGRSRRASAARCCRPTTSSPGKHPVVVISDGLWRASFASDPAIVGKTIQVDGYPLTVVGVTEPAFAGRFRSCRSMCSCP